MSTFAASSTLLRVCIWVLGCKVAAEVNDLRQQVLSLKLGIFIQKHSFTAMLSQLDIFYWPLSFLSKSWRKPILQCSDHLESLLKHRLLGHTSKASDPVGFSRVQICFSNLFSDDTCAGLQTTLQVLYYWVHVNCKMVYITWIYYKCNIKTGSCSKIISLLWYLKKKKNKHLLRAIHIYVSSCCLIGLEFLP